MVNYICLDIDGVMANWHKPCAELFGLTEDELMRRWPPMEFDIEHALGVTSEELWRRVDGGGAAYWADLEETPWARRLYDYCKSVAPTIFLTTPSHHPPSLAGKVEWMKRFTGNDKFRDYLIGQKKFMCAKPGTVLVDDADKNIDKFVAAGGHGITFPRIWNCMYAHDGDPCDFVISQIEALRA